MAIKQEPALQRLADLGGHRCPNAPRMLAIPRHRPAQSCQNFRIVTVVSTDKSLVDFYSRGQYMKSFVGYMVGLCVLISAVGCTGIRVVHRGGYGPYDPAMPGCDTCGCEVTAPVGCDDGCHGPGILHRVADRLRSTHCNSGCGEVYWDEQINEPRVCDPCCFNGGYVGGESCGRCPVGLQDSVSCGVFDTYHRTAAHVPPLPQDTAKAVRLRA